MKRPGKTNAELIAEGKLPPHYAVGKSDGDAAVRRWIGLLPGWQRARAGEIDALVGAVHPGVARAIRYNGAWYGTPGAGFHLALNPLKRLLKITFFDGQSLDPPPPVALKIAPAAALDLRETDPLDADRLADWIRQAVTLPGYGKAPG